MNVLLDECLPLDLRHYIQGHITHTVKFARLNGKKNGDLLRAAEEAGYHVFVTVDQGIQFQQSLSSRRISIAVLMARTNQLEHLIPLTGALLLTLETIQPGQLVRIPS